MPYILLRQFPDTINVLHHLVAYSNRVRHSLGLFGTIMEHNQIIVQHITTENLRLCELSDSFELHDTILSTLTTFQLLVQLLQREGAWLIGFPRRSQERFPRTRERTVSWVAIS